LVSRNTLGGGARAANIQRHPSDSERGQYDYTVDFAQASETSAALQAIVASQFLKMTYDELTGFVGPAMEGGHGVRFRLRVFHWRSRGKPAAGVAGLLLL
jgi:hypothetical protein